MAFIFLFTAKSTVFLIISGRITFFIMADSVVDQLGLLNKSQPASLNARNAGNTLQSQQPLDDFRPHFLMPNIADLFYQNGISILAKVFLRPNINLS
jgi:hypothetical protein